MANIRHYGNEIAVGEAGGTFLGKCFDRIVMMLMLTTMIMTTMTLMVL